MLYRIVGLRARLLMLILDCICPIFFPSIFGIMNEFLYPRFEKVRGYTGLHLSVVPIICPSFSLSVYHFVFFIRLYILQAKQRAYSQIF